MAHGGLPVIDNVTLDILTGWLPCGENFLISLHGPREYQRTLRTSWIIPHWSAFICVHPWRKILRGLRANKDWIASRCDGEAPFRPEGAISSRRHRRPICQYLLVSLSRDEI